MTIAVGVITAVQGGNGGAGSLSLAQRRLRDTGEAQSGPERSKNPSRRGIVQM
jgi:hypothetical protein